MAARFLIVALCVWASSALAGPKMVVIGGGARPEAANARFIKWAGGSKARILVFSWSAGPDGNEYFEYLRDSLLPHGATHFDHAVDPASVLSRRPELIAQIQGATGIFFSGGDQNIAMDVLEADEKNNPGPASLLHLIREKYASGTVLGGTSAGCAVMTTPMLTGSADLTVLDGKQVETRAGLGLLPNIIFDQHFLARFRVLRLMGLIQEHPTRLGVGIDESTAMLIEDSRVAEVVGEGQVLIIQADGPGPALKVDPLKAGTRYDLLKRARL